MKRKIICLIFSICFICTFSACKQSKPANSESHESSIVSIDNAVSEEVFESEISVDAPAQKESSQSESPSDKYFVTGQYNFEYVVANDKCLLTKYHGGSSESDKNVIVPSTLLINGTDYPTEIGAGCFMDTEIITLFLPDNITAIPDSMCKNCTNLSSVTFSNVESIGKDAFRKCENYKVQMSELNNGHPEKIKSIGSGAFTFSGLFGKVIISPDLSVDEAAFTACNNISEVEITEGVTALPAFIFSECEGITKITLPESLQSIGKRAFYRANMSTITIPKNVTELGDYFVGTNTITNRFNYAGIIIGYRGSVAEQYAAERNILFTAID